MTFEHSMQFVREKTTSNGSARKRIGPLYKKVFFNLVFDAVTDFSISVLRLFSSTILVSACRRKLFHVQGLPFR